MNSLQDNNWDYMCLYLLQSGSWTAVKWILCDYHPPVFDRQQCLYHSHLPLHCRRTLASHSHNRGTGWSSQHEESSHLRPGHLSLGHHRSNTLPKTQGRKQIQHLRDTVPIVNDGYWFKLKLINMWIWCTLYPMGLPGGGSQLRRMFLGPVALALGFAGESRKPPIAVVFGFV